MNSKLILSTKLNYEERSVWSMMTNTLKEHNSYYVRQQYYPLNMENWENKKKEIEQEYRGKLEEMITMRLAFEAKEKLREDELDAAKALVMMNKRKSQKRKRAEDNSNTVLRRSSRISTKK